MKDWTGEIDKHVSDGVNKLLTEDMCDLTAQEGVVGEGARGYLEREPCGTSEARLRTRCAQDLVQAESE